MKSIVCLISGRGSNLAALLAAAQSEQWEATIGARVAATISSRPEAGGLAIAQALARMPGGTWVVACSGGPDSTALVAVYWAPSTSSVR